MAACRACVGKAAEVREPAVAVARRPRAAFAEAAGQSSVVAAHLPLVGVAEQVG